MRCKVVTYWDIMILTWSDTKLFFVLRNGMRTRILNNNTNHDNDYSLDELIRSMDIGVKSSQKAVLTGTRHINLLDDAMGNAKQNSMAIGWNSIYAEKTNQSLITQFNRKSKGANNFDA